MRPVRDVSPWGILNNNPLDRALELAAQAKGGVTPRPAVGAVVVRDDKIIGEGATEPTPGNHAETIALNQAGDGAKGATLYCSLEPHSFQGVTAPCTDAIINSGIRKVVSPIEDPNPRVSGNGFRQLRSAGVEISQESNAEQKLQAEILVEGFAHYLKTRRPLVTLKIATSLDGKNATRTGNSQWITNEQSRSRVHEMRRQTDALITGIGTILADDPRLTSREPSGSSNGRPRLRVVIDSNGRMPSTAALLSEPGEILWAVAEDVEVRPPTDSVTILKSSRCLGKVDLAVVVGELGTRRLHHALIEAGGDLAGAFNANNMIDKVAAFIAPRLIGGVEATGPVGGQGAESITDALSLERVTHEPLGSDILIEGYVRKLK